MADKDALLEKQLLDQSAAAATAGNVSSPASYALVEIAKYSLKEGTQSFAYIEELDKTGENRPLIPISSSDECLVILQPAAGIDEPHVVADFGMANVPPESGLQP